MPCETTISLNDYLAITFRPDCEYIEGMLVQRNMGDYDHSSTQASLIGYLGSRHDKWNIRVRNSQRMRVSKNRIRVSDLSVIRLRAPRDPIIIQPPLICIEVVSAADTIEEMQYRIDDYVAFGVQNIWLVNPRTRRAFAYDGDGCREAKDGVLRTADGEISMPLAEVLKGPP